jgi:hypothetical protein
MPIDGYESMAITAHARERLRDLLSLLLEYGVPKGIKLPNHPGRRSGGLTLSAVVEIAVDTTERELKKKGKR